jgi:outer membrane biogenesis lipoprotein LolB
VHNCRGTTRNSPLKSIAAIVVTAAVLITLSACTRWAERPLIGSYQLVHPTGCRDDIEDSTLVIRDDGTYDQHVQFKSGRNETVENAHWTYDRAARRINFSKFLVSTETSFSTEASHPAMILVNRSADCWYQHPK